MPVKSFGLFFFILHKTKQTGKLEFCIFFFLKISITKYIINVNVSHDICCCCLSFCYTCIWSWPIYYIFFQVICMVHSSSFLLLIDWSILFFQVARNFFFVIPRWLIFKKKWRKRYHFFLITSSHHHNQLIHQ